MDLPPIPNSPPKANGKSLPSLRKLLPKPDQDKPSSYTVSDSIRGPTLAPMRQPGAHSVLNVLNSGKEPTLKPKLRTALMSALNNFQVVGNSIPQLLVGTSTLARLDISSSTYQTMFSTDDALVASICKIVNTKDRTPHESHCVRVNCKLLAGCDIAYNPYSDPYGVIRHDDRHREKAYEPYESPFQRKLTYHSPKKRKLSPDSNKASDGQTADNDSTSSGTTGPFSERSWIAIELFLIMNWTNPDCPGHVIVEGLLKIMPVLDLTECFALDMLRVTYPVPNIYDDDDEDESTEGAKIHRLHEKVWHMPPEYLTPRMNEIYWRLMQLGHLPDLVLMPPSQDWNPSLDIVSLIDEPGYNYCFVGGDKKLYYISARFTMEDMEPAQLQISLEEYQEDEQKKLKKRNNARNLYHDRLEWHGIRNEAGMEAVRMVHELRCNPSTNSRIQVEAVRLNYEKRGLPWHWKFSPTVSPIEPGDFAHWVDKLDNKEFAYALAPIQDWAIAGIKLSNVLEARPDTYTSSTNGHVAENPLKAPLGELSPGKRSYSEVSWDTEDEEIPSNSPPPDEADILRFEQQRIIGLRGMTEDDLLKQVLEHSMNEIDEDRHMEASQPVQQTKTVSVVPELADQQPEDFMTPKEIDELNERMFEWALSMSSNPNLGPFPKKEVADEIKLKRPQSHVPLAKALPRLKVQLNPQVSHLSVKKSPPKASIATGGLDGVEEQLPLLTSLVSWSFPESFERGPKSHPPISDRAGWDKDNRMKEDYIVDDASHAHEIIPPTKSSYNPYKEIVAKAARDNGLIDMKTYRSIFNKNEGGGNGWAQKDQSRRQAGEDAKTFRQYRNRPLSPSPESIDITDQKHATDNDPSFKNGHYVPSPLLSKSTTSRKEEYEKSENVMAVHVEEVGENGNDESPPPPQRLHTEHDISLRTLTMNKQKWLKEDEEYKRIIRSEQSLSEHLAQEDIPLSRRSTAIVSVVIRDQEQREAWILKKAGLKVKISLPLFIANVPAFVPAGATAARASSAPSRTSSVSSCASISSYATTQEKDIEVANVARGLALVVNTTPRRSVSVAGAAGNDRDVAEETAPFPKFKKTDSNEKLMPVADMEFCDHETSLSNSACTDGGVRVGSALHGGAAWSLVRDGNGAGSLTSSQGSEVRYRDAVSEVRRTLAEVEVIPESPEKCGVDGKMPDVDTVELSPEDLAKAA